MLGLVLAGNIFQVFVFWELVGVCSFFLIGFYVERKSASTRRQQSVHHEPRRGLRVPDRADGSGNLLRHLPSLQIRSPEEFGTPGLFQMVRDTHGHMVTEG
jgi:hypothetical protein